mgnify:CR=1 FL=1
MTGSGLTERLPRLLSLVPYLLARPGIPLADVAADFGIGERQLRRDLELLWMCGLPGYGPGDLVDLSFAGDTVTVTEDAGMRRPLRLTTAEGTALLVASALMVLSTSTTVPVAVVDQLRAQPGIVGAQAIELDKKRGEFINKKLAEDEKSRARDSFDNQVLQVLQRQAGRANIQYGVEEKKK